MKVKGNRNRKANILLSPVSKTETRCVELPKVLTTSSYLKEKKLYHKVQTRLRI